MSDIIPPNNIPLKRCPNCPEDNQWHPATTEFFQRDKSKKDGLRCSCKACENARERRKYTENREEAHAKRAQYSSSHREQIRQQERRYYAMHRESIRQRVKELPEHAKEERRRKERQHYAEHREEELWKRREYVSKNRDKIKQQRREYYTQHKEHINQRRREWRLQHRDVISQQNKHWREKDPEKVRRIKHLYHVNNRDAIRERKRRYRAIHKEEIAQKKQQYYQNNQQQIRQYRREHRDRARIHETNRYARKRILPGKLTSAQIQEKLKQQHYRCYYAACGFAKFEKRNGRYIYHLEHTVPISRTEANPRHDINFIVLACPSCNLSKQNKLPHEWPEGGRLF